MLPSISWSFDFKGIKLGAASTVTEVQEKTGVICGSGVDPEKTSVCNGDTTIAREPAYMNLLINDGIVQRIDFTLSSDSFDIVAPELIKKFGKPTRVRHSVVQNRMGAKYPQVEYLWSSKDGREVRYEKYYFNLDKSNLNFSTKADREMLYGGKNRSGDI